MGRRDELVVATKVGGRDGQRAQHLRAQPQAHHRVAATLRLRRLSMDYIDLYQIHSLGPGQRRWRRRSRRWTPSCGRARFATWASATPARGCLPRRCSPAREHGWHRFVSVQNHYNLIYREDEREVTPLCLDQGVGLIPWRPLARGFLTSNRDRSRQGAAPARRKRSVGPAYRDDDYEMVDMVAKMAPPAASARRWSRWPGCCKRRR